MLRLSGPLITTSLPTAPRDRANAAAGFRRTQPIEPLATATRDVVPSFPRKVDDL